MVSFKDQILMTWVHHLHKANQSYPLISIQYIDNLAETFCLPESQNNNEHPRWDECSGCPAAGADWCRPLVFPPPLHTNSGAPSTDSCKSKWFHGSMAEARCHTSLSDFTSWLSTIIITILKWFEEWSFKWAKSSAVPFFSPTDRIIPNKTKSIKNTFFPLKKAPFQRKLLSRDTKWSALQQLQDNLWIFEIMT